MMLSRVGRLSSSWGVGSFLSVGLGLKALAQFVLVVAFTRFEDVETAASFILLLAVIAPLQPLTEMALRPVYVLRKEVGDHATLLKLRASAYAALVSVVAPVSVIALGIPFSVVAGLLLLKFAEGVLDAYLAVFQRFGEIPRMARYIAINAITSVILMGVFSFLLESATVLLYVSSSVSVFAVLLARHRARQILTKAGMRSVGGASEVGALLREGFPMGAGAALRGLGGATPQYALAFRSANEVAIFAYLSYAVVAADLLVGGVSQAMLSRVRAARDDMGAGRLVGMLSRWSVAMGVLTCGFGLATAIFIQVLTRFGAGLTIDIGIESWLVLSAILLLLPSAYFFEIGLQARGLTADVFWTSSWAGVVSVSASVPLVLHFGIFGALCTVLLSLVTRFLLSLRFLLTGSTPDLSVGDCCTDR